GPTNTMPRYSREASMSSGSAIIGAKSRDQAPRSLRRYAAAASLGRMRRGGGKSSATSRSTSAARACTGDLQDFRMHVLAHLVDCTLGARYLLRRQPDVTLQDVRQRFQHQAQRLKRCGVGLAHVIARNQLATLSREPQR